MGEVYRARDTQLDRGVAIKILPESFALDADRVARFTRDAKTLASLNHPNMAHLHGLEESGGVSALDPNSSSATADAMHSPTLTARATHVPVKT
jgi:serine/threonine protein kinase